MASSLANESISNTDRTARWYSVVLLFSSSIGDVASLRPLCEERVVLFRSNTAGEIDAAARRYAEREQHSYQNANGETVNWRFHGIERIEPLAEPPANEGWEVSSRYARRSLATLRKGK
jgi:hypothetical protein